MAILHDMLQITIKFRSELNSRTGMACTDVRMID